MLPGKVWRTGALVGARDKSSLGLGLLEPHLGLQNMLRWWYIDNLKLKLLEEL
jgi:hypothetical protein